MTNNIYTHIEPNNNIYIELGAPESAKYIILFYNSIYHNRLHESITDLYPRFKDFNMYDIENGAIYTMIEDINEINHIINKIINGHNI
jgi:hypothetical protein